MQLNSIPLLKIMMLGETNVGKTSIVLRFTENCFENN